MSSPQFSPPLVTRDYFSKAADKYVALTGYAVVEVSQFIADSANLPKITSETRILDNASGPGVSTKVILDKFARDHPGKAPPHIIASDSSEGMVDTVRAKVATGDPLWHNVDPQVRDARDMKHIPDNSIDLMIMSFAIYYMGDGVDFMAEMRRILKPGGLSVVTTWKVNGALDIVNRIRKVIRPSSERWFPADTKWEKPESLESASAQAGFEESKMRTEVAHCKARYANIQDFVDFVCTRGSFFDIARDGWRDDEIDRWKDVIWDVMTEEEKRTGTIQMDAWVHFAWK